jgi:hypothetical protein
VSITVNMDLLIYLAEAGLIGFLPGLILGRVSAPKKEKEQEREGRGEPETSNEPVEWEKALGLDKALTARFYRDLHRAIKNGRVRVSLISEECPNGYVTYDFARQEWLCVERDGSSYPLGGRPAGELFIEESEGE